jgi:hypothetical protein
VLERSEKALGAEHPDTLTCFGNLALVLQHQGKYDEAETMERREGGEEGEEGECAGPRASRHTDEVLAD